MPTLGCLKFGWWYCKAAKLKFSMLQNLKMRPPTRSKKRTMSYWLSIHLTICIVMRKLERHMKGSFVWRATKMTPKQVSHRNIEMHLENKRQLASRVSQHKTFIRYVNKVDLLDASEIEGSCVHKVWALTYSSFPLHWNLLMIH